MRLALVDRVRWRTSQSRVHEHAKRLLAETGPHALFRAVNCAHRALGDDDPCQARYWRAVSGEISRQMQRDQILKDLYYWRARSADARRCPVTSVPGSPGRDNARGEYPSFDKGGTDDESRTNLFGSGDSPPRNRCGLRASAERSLLMRTKGEDGRAECDRPRPICRHLVGLGRA
jgi:hypothetical protein